MRNFYYDTEFIEGTQPGNSINPTIDLISIGVVSENGKQYYAIANDFNIDYAWNKDDAKKGNPVYWLRENVLKPIFDQMVEIKNKPHITYEFDLPTFKNLIAVIGKPKEVIKKELIEFINPFEANPIKMIGYYSAYDHVVLCWLFGKMIDLPKGMPMYTYDLKQEIDVLVESIINKRFYGKDNHTPIKYKDVLNELKEHPNYPKNSNHHSAIDDALWTRELAFFLRNI